MRPSEKIAEEHYAEKESHPSADRSDALSESVTASAPEPIPIDPAAEFFKNFPGTNVMSCFDDSILDIVGRRKARRIYDTVRKEEDGGILAIRYNIENAKTKCQAATWLYIKMMAYHDFSTKELRKSLETKRRTVECEYVWPTGGGA